MKLTIMQLVHLLTTSPTGGKRGNNFITIVARSSASSVRKNGIVGGLAVVNRYYKDLTHIYMVNVQTGFDTQRRVSKVRAVAGLADRKIEAPVNEHEKIAPQIVRQRNGNIGLACEVIRWQDSQYTCNSTGELVNRDYLTPFKPATDKDIDYLTPNLCNLVSVIIDGQDYEIDGSDYEQVKITLGPTLPTLDE
jgi:hypothetical protein